MIRQMIKIDEKRCNGCELCVKACHEGAIQMQNGKAVLVREDYCDGLGNCLPVCPTGAISFETRESVPYNGLPVETTPSNLKHWPVQIRLVPVNAPHFANANLLIAADCAAFAHPSFHQTYMKNKVVLIGCPKLDMTDYAEKFTDILNQNTIQSITIVKMEVPCCNGLLAAVILALRTSGKVIPWSVVTLSTEGDVLE